MDTNPPTLDTEKGQMDIHLGIKEQNLPVMDIQPMIMEEDIRGMIAEVILEAETLEVGAEEETLEVDSVKILNVFT